MLDHVAVSKRKRIIQTTLFYLLVIIMLMIVLFPFFWMILASFKINADILNIEKLFSFVATFKNYISVFIDYNFVKPFFLLVSHLGTFLTFVQHSYYFHMLYIFFPLLFLLLFIFLISWIINSISPCC